MDSETIITAERISAKIQTIPALQMYKSNGRITKSKPSFVTTVQSGLKNSLLKGPKLKLNNICRSFLPYKIVSHLKISEIIFTKGNIWNGLALSLTPVKKKLNFSSVLAVFN